MTNKWETHQHVSQYWQLFILLLTVCIFMQNEEAAPHIDAGAVDSLVLKRDWRSPCCPWMIWMVYKCLFYPSRTANGINLSNERRKKKYVNPCINVPGIFDQRPYIDQVSSRTGSGKPVYQMETFSALLTLCAGNPPVTRGIHRSPVNFPHKGQWRGALMFFLSAPE